MLKIWGRTNSVNVQKALWCLAELDVPYERVDAGLAYGKNHEPWYLALNPNGRVPLLQDGDFSLWNPTRSCVTSRRNTGSGAYAPSRSRRARTRNAGWIGNSRCS